jgi:hypothetical protein
MQAPSSAVKTIQAPNIENFYGPTHSATINSTSNAAAAFNVSTQQCGLFDTG